MKSRSKTTEILRLLRLAIEDAGSQKALADKLKVSPQYIGDVIHGRRDPGESILDGLGINKTIVYMAVNVIRLELRTSKIEFKRSTGVWYPVPKEWDYDREAGEFVYRRSGGRESRYRINDRQVDNKYIYASLPLSQYGEILV